MKLVIVGGVAGGASAAARIRRLDEQAEIIILERTQFVSYANCGLPYYVGEVITDKKKLTLQTPESFSKRFNIEVRVRHEVEAIDRASKTLRVCNLDEECVYSESYDILILSPGAQPLKPPVPGIQSERIFTLRSVEDTFKIKEFCDKYRSATRKKTEAQGVGQSQSLGQQKTLVQKNPDQQGANGLCLAHALVIGGGFIGLEMAENLVERGFKVTILQRSKQLMPPLDFDMASFVHDYMRSRGIELRFSQHIQAFETKEDSVCVKLESNDSISADFAIMAVGVVPDSHLAREAGLNLGSRGAIRVDAHMRTSDPFIYAVGDAIEFKNYVTDQSVVTALAGPANKQGRIAADNICGISRKFSGAQGSCVLKLFDMCIASTGINEKTALSLGLSYDKVITSSPSHASYYPGASTMTIKTLFDSQSGRILGAQIVGFEGVDKRIDVIAVALRAKMTSTDLAELDLAYAPPFSSAKDPVNMAGFVIENIREGFIKQVHWHEIADLQKQQAQLINVATAREFAEGHIEDSINIPLDELRDRIEEIDRSKPVYLYCFSGLRSYIANRIVAGYGIDSYNLSGGYRFYRQVISELSKQAI